MSQKDSYGPVVIASCMLGLAFSVAPMIFATLGVFLKPLSTEFGWSRGQISSAISVMGVTIALVAPYFGKLTDRIGPRAVIMGSTLLFCAAVAAMAALPNSYAVYLVIAALIGIFSTGSNTFVYLAVLPRWFDKRLGLSLGIAMMGIGIGQFIAPQYATWLIAQFGWRSAYLALAATILVITVPNAYFLLRDRQGRTDVMGESPVAAVGGSTGAEALRTPVFWRLAVAFGLMNCAIYGCFIHIVPLLTDRGQTAMQAAAIAGLLGISVIVGRLITGVLLDYISASILGGIAFAGAALGIAMLLIGTASPWPVQVNVLLIGLALGVEGDLIAYMVRRLFGLKAYATIYGYLFTAFNVGGLIGPVVVGATFDASGSYNLGLSLMLGSAIVAAVLILLPARHVVPASVTAPRATA